MNLGFEVTRLQQKGSLNIKAQKEFEKISRVKFLIRNMTEDDAFNCYKERTQSIKVFSNTKFFDWTFSLSPFLSISLSFCLSSYTHNISLNSFFRSASFFCLRLSTLFQYFLFIWIFKTTHHATLTSVLPTYQCIYVSTLSFFLYICIVYMYIY